MLVVNMQIKGNILLPALSITIFVLSITVFDKIAYEIPIVLDSIFDLEIEGRER